MFSAISMHIHLGCLVLLDIARGITLVTFKIGCLVQALKDDAHPRVN